MDDDSVNDALSDSVESDSSSSDSPISKKRKGVDDDLDEIENDCEFCGLIFDDTSELNRHLEICPENNEEASEISSTDESPEPFVFNQERARAAIVKCIVFDDLPFRFASAVKFFQTINPEFEPISCKDVMEDIKKLYIDEKEVLLEYFKNYIGKVSLSYRLWKSETDVFDYDHVSLTAHYIDSDWKLQKRMLCFCLVDYPTNREWVGEVIKNQVRKWGLENKIFSITLDTCDSDDVVPSCIDDVVPSCIMKFIPVKDDDTIFHVSCCAPLFNSIAKDGFQEIKSFLERIERVLLDKHMNRSRRDEFREVCKALGMEYKKILPTFRRRWDYKYLMLDGVVSYRTVFDRYISEKQDEYPPFTDDDWFSATMIRDYLRVFYNATTSLCRNYYVTSSQFLLQIFEIGYEFKEYQTNPMFSRVYGEMKRKIQNYWEGFPILYGLCSIMDPRIKLSGLEKFLEFIYKNGVYDIDSGCSHNDRLAEIKSTLEKLFEKHQSQKRSGQSKESGSSPSLAQGKCWEFLNLQSPESSTKSELQWYIEEPKVDIYHGCDNPNDFDILGWWKAREHLYPVLASMARDLLMVPVSSVVSDSAFHEGEGVVDGYKAKLSEYMLNCSSCLRDWYRAETENRLQDVVCEDDDTDYEEEIEELEKLEELNLE